MNDNSEPKLPAHPQWWATFTDREIKEIRFARVYENEFAHGTTGHNALMIIAKMAKLLDEAEAKQQEGNV